MFKKLKKKKNSVHRAKNLLCKKNLIFLSILLKNIHYQLIWIT